MTPLCALASKHITDKGGNHFFAGDICHNYTPIYYDLFKDKRENVQRVLEIGVNTGASLRMWEEFFPRAEIIGIDNNKDCLFSKGRIYCYWGDQGEPKTLGIGAAHWQPFDLIVDDGSHETHHQINSLWLLPYLTRKGLYVIEDLRIGVDPHDIGRFVPDKFVWEVIPAPGALGRKVYQELLMVIRRG